MYTRIPACVHKYKKYAHKILWPHVCEYIYANVRADKTPIHSVYNKA